jgi:hypothetical protein
MKKIIEKNHYGVWIDTERARICKRDKTGTFSSEEVHSGVETHPRFAGEQTDKTGLFGRTINRQRKDQGHLNHDLHAFLRKVADRLIEPGSVLIMGPAQVRFDLQNELERRKEFKGVPTENKASELLSAEQLLRLMQHEAAF